MRKSETLHKPPNECPASPIWPQCTSFVCVTKLYDFLLREPIADPWSDILQLLFPKHFEVILQQLHCCKWTCNANHSSKAVEHSLCTNETCADYIARGLFNKQSREVHHTRTHDHTQTSGHQLRASRVHTRTLGYKQFAA